MKIFTTTTYDLNIIVSNGQIQRTNDGVLSSTTIQFILTVVATLSFDYGVSSETNYDKLTIIFNGSNIGYIDNLVIQPRT